MHNEDFEELYQLIKEDEFNWHSRDALKNLKEEINSCEDKKVKKEIASYILGKVAYMEDNEIDISDLNYATSLKELKQGLFDTTEKLNLYNQIYEACDVNDDVLNKFMNRIFSNVLKALNDYFVELFAYMTGKTINIDAIKDDKYFTALEYPFTLKELTNYRKKIAKIYHPDNGGNEEDMAKINEIFEVLKMMI